MYFNLLSTSHTSLSRKDISESLWIRKRCAKWLLAVLEFDAPCTDGFFQCVGWVVGGMEQLRASLGTDLSMPAGRAREVINARKSIRELKDSRNKRIDRELEILFDENPILHGQIRELIRGYLKDWLKDCKGKARSIFPRGFASLFSLGDDLLEICAFAWGISNYRAIENYFEDELDVQSNSNAPVLAKILSMSSSRLRQARANLRNLGILDDCLCNMRLSASIEEALGMGSMGQMQKFFCRNISPTDVPLDQFRLPEDAKTHALRLLGRSSSDPVHLLLYGAPGTGKTSFAARLAETLEMRAWAVACRESDTVRDRRISLTACMNLARLHPGSLILVDEAERLLDTDGMDTDNGSSKAWLNDLLERKNLRIIWITNKIQHIDQAVRRRFSFSIHFENPGKMESCNMWNNVAKRQHVENRLPQDAIERFVSQYPVPVAMMENAVRQARTISGKKDFCECVERILKSYLTLRGDGQWQSLPDNLADDYDPEAVCATVLVHTLEARLKRLREKISATSARGMGNLLFYGPPGTGKTALAKYLARKLGCECVMRRASDLISPFVGETERNIAEAFREAENQHALLLVDEVDTFIFNHENAQRSWEHAMVNEFLTCLENFGGICVCTTNFRKVIDSAGMRRFPFKVEFRYAQADQLRRLYKTVLEPLCDCKAEERTLDIVARQKHLAPGDFHAVKSQLWLEESENLTHEHLTQCLLREQSLKLESGAKKVGFEI